MSTRPTSSTGQSYPSVLGYQIVQLLGGGGFSRVFRAVNPKSNEHPQAAVKVVSYASTTNRQPIDRRALQKEVQIHSILKHKNVLEFLGSVEYAVGSEAPSNYVRGLYILLELGAGGDLFDKIAPDVGVEEDLAHFYFTQLISGLSYIHSQGVSHRDIKPENMLLDAQGNLKIADFGLCSVYKYKGKERSLHGTCGSLPYIAPEMNGQPYHGEPIDVWSSGVVLFALLVGNTPWDEPTGRSPEYRAYLSGDLLRMDPWTRVSGDALSLLRRMMHPDPKKRSSLQQIQRHRWYTRDNALLTSGKCNDPVSLAERLLQGLIVSGDVQLALHSDGQRASVPESVSLSQPEAMQPRPLSLGREDVMPSSTAQPALAARRGLASTQQARVSHTQNEEPAAEFTQALEYLTQSTAVPNSGTMAVHLTRFYSREEPGKIASGLATALERQKAQFSLEPLGQDTELQEAYEDMENGLDAETKPSQPLAGARGVRIRLGLVDRRKCALKGDIRIERLAELPMELDQHRANTSGSFVLMRRSKGNPLEWRRLFRDLCTDISVREMIARPT
ncbi:non-specific serine/threonine protein kinase [Malassezia psittaci]|uniref:non-specific serine/threonine protein kinase n=1 Tax=Malassezia psittaci TaxID=1821823 RepID=A0AAF0F818_9BASI|nr:non-specific serine/threonine protein kinase [Malassezia psittaci]